MGKETSESETESMGYKDKAKALYTLKCLDGRDITYQFRAITHYHTSAKKILKITKDQDKVKNIQEAIEVFDEWLRDYRDNERGKGNMSYLPIETIEALESLAKDSGVSNEDFYNAYKEANGDYKALRTLKIADGSTTWDIERNKRLKKIIENGKNEGIEWYETDDDSGKKYPSKIHMQCISLAYSPEPSKLKALIPKILEKSDSSHEDEMIVDEIKNSKKGTKRNRKDSSHEDEMIVDEIKKSKKGTKRNRNDSSSGESSVDEEPAKKITKESPESEKQEEGSALGFKDKEKALKSIDSMEGRDVTYQYHAISGLIKRATRVISLTKDEEKIKNMKEAIDIFENWITDYTVNHRSKENFGYLMLDLVRAYEPLAVHYGIEISGFLKIYEEVHGDYKKLRSIKTPEGVTTWDIERNKELGPIVKEIKDKYIQWFETDEPLRGLPTKEHTRCIMWGFSHEPTKLRKLVPTLKDKLKLVE